MAELITLEEDTPSMELCDQIVHYQQLVFVCVPRLS